jgi:hypothetical protein
LRGTSATKHSNGSVEVVSDGETRCRVIWIVDVLPHEIAGYLSAQMDLGAAAIQKAFVRKRLATAASDCDLSHRGCSA